MTESATPLVGKLLIAMPTLADPNFWHTVVLVGVHSDDEGAFGLVVNRPLEIDLKDILDELGETVPEGSFPQVLAGGPVEPSHGFVMYESPDAAPDESALRVEDRISVSGSTETLANLARGEVGGRYYLLLGYSGWYPGQLEREIEENSWLVAPLDTTILFDVPLEERWHAALRSIGVDPGTLVDMGSSAPS
jgi:putative transcriptional regulator